MWKKLSSPGKCKFWKKKTVQTSNKCSTPQLLAYATNMQQISIYLVVNVTFKYTADARSYRHVNFTILLKRKSNTHVLIVPPTGLVDLSSDGVDVLINDIKEHLVEIETINNLLRENNKYLGGENIQNINNLKAEKINNANNVKDLETKIKKMQTKLSKANRKSAENVKEINRMKHQISTVHRIL